MNGGGHYTLEASVVEASNYPYSSGQSLNQSFIKNAPNGNGDITSLLKVLPNVQFDNNQLNSNTPGEIDPANISISGGLYYQNSFLLDGMSMNNDLSGGVNKPGMNEDYTPGEQREFSGRSQGLNIDSFLLENISVQDSNIGASYGGFTGGVVEATTKKARKEFGANFAYQISQGNASPGAFSLTQYHIYGNEEEFLNSSSGSNQPKFIKHSFRSSLESRINDKLGIIASFTTTQSFIPVKEFVQDQNTPSNLVSVDRKEKRQSYNFFIKADYQASDDVALETSYAFMPQYNKYYNADYVNSGTTIKSGGHNLGAKAYINNKFGFLTAQTSFSYLEESRRSDAKGTKTWIYSADKNWGDPNDFQYEGSFGDEDNIQSDIELKLNQSFEPYYNDNFENIFNAGFELGYTKAHFKRLSESSDVLSPFGIEDQNYVCQDEYCSSAPVDPSNNLNNPTGDNYGQFLGVMNKYKKGKISLDSTNLAFFIEDELKFDLDNKGDINTRLGLRMDYDTYMQKAPIAPRFSFKYIAPWGRDDRLNTNFIFGANRYYGRNLFAYRLADGKSALEENYVRMDPNQNFDESTLVNAVPNNTSFKKLKIPYDDELSVSLTQEFYHFDLVGKYIHRFGRDQIQRNCIIDPTSNACSSVYTYDNTGRSDSDIITLSVQNSNPFALGFIDNYFLFAFDYTQTKRSYNDFNDEFDPIDREYAEYQGSIIKLKDLPSSNFTRPYTLRLTSTHQLKKGRTTWLLNNFFRYRGAYQALVNTSERMQNIDGLNRRVYVYENERIAGNFSWDMRVGFDIDISKGNIFYTNIDILNVLNRRITTTGKTATRTIKKTYETGRQFWVEVGYRY
ncbi:TonB-dependent receptor [Campylobacter sp. MIT 12-8780]|nr:TonB-dependent receptor plug domain-containing protein [Campylobacter sp. MIT 19-121]TQR41313.1 TonB-dependent receptor [Campylobacter sp. MIT 12-8780]